MPDQKPAWLPNIVSVNGEWQAVLRKLYAIFENDFVKTGCHFTGMPVWWDRRKLAGDIYEEGFWHLITKEDKSANDRLLDPRRAERLPWCKPTIENCHDGEVKVWDYRESKREIRTYVWLENWDYVVILRKRPQQKGTIAFLLTAFHVDHESTRKGLRRKYANRES
jgi:hypothetical protein